MILYTPLPMEAIFPVPDDPAPPRWMSIHGRLCLVEPDACGLPRIVRLGSTNPDDFLDPRFQPGTLLTGQATDL